MRISKFNCCLCFLYCAVSSEPNSSNWPHQYQNYDDHHHGHSKLPLQFPFKEISLLATEIKEMFGSVGTLRKTISSLSAYRGDDSDEEFDKFMRLMVDIRAELKTDKPELDKQYSVHKVIEDCFFPGPN